MSLRVPLAATSDRACNPRTLTGDASKRDGTHTPAVPTDTLTRGGARLCTQPTAVKEPPRSPVLFSHSEGQSSPGHSWDSRACSDLPGKLEIAWKQEVFLSGSGATDYAAAQVAILEMPQLYPELLILGSLG
ncbi:hypothetical protein NDU88_004368 [Pleurodeles waltl]|uniref:Uncharacterized protein n=1 Tax=Pleurodeles waltl TaxID=8319 RepID=A0AAV7UF27_PLEWA|nr:hypothetical protein NDU88_004368 [Pleurodeles waltl]